jgi:hypothetical protein
MIRKWQFILVQMAVGACVGRAAIIADWTFESSQPYTTGPFAPEQGSGSALASGVSSVSSPVGDGSAHSFSATHWVSGDYFQFTTSTLGYDDIVITFEARGSDTGPRNFKLTYSTDGISFTDIGTYALINDSWSSTVYHSASAYTFNLSSMDGVNNDGSIYFRLVDTSAAAGGAINGGYVGTGGTSVVDDFTVSGVEAVPEPGESGAIAGAGLLALCGWRAWRQRNASCPFN